jgi:hypothetical protein
MKVRRYYKMTSDRITIMLDKDIAKKLRYRQAELLKKSNKSISFSQVLNDCLKICIAKKMC